MNRQQYEWITLTDSLTLTDSVRITLTESPTVGQTHVRCLQRDMVKWMLHPLHLWSYHYVPWIKVFTLPTALGSNSLILEEVQSQDAEAFSLRSLTWEVAGQGLKSRWVQPHSHWTNPLLSELALTWTGQETGDTPSKIDLLQFERLFESFLCQCKLSISTQDWTD